MNRYPRAPLQSLAFFQEGPGLRNWQWAPAGIKVINGTNIREQGHFDPSNTDKYVAYEEFDARYRHFSIDEGDIVVSSSGTIGKVARVLKHHLPMMMNTSVIRFRSLPGMDHDYLYAWLRSEDFQEQARAFAHGAAQLNFGPVHLKQMTVAVPPLGVQRRIAEILGSYDDLIEVNRRRVALLEDMARCLFDEWFVRLRFPGHEDVAIMETAEGLLLPAGWRVMPLEAVADVNAASLRPATAPNRIGYIDIASVSPGQVDAINWMPFAEAPGRARRCVKDGSILWSNVRPNRRSYALLTRPDGAVIASTGFTVLDARKVPPSYLYCYTTTATFVAYLVGRATGAAYPAVTASVFSETPVRVPPEGLLRRFSKLAASSFELADNLRQSNRRLAASRDLLLPRLISGQLSVAEAEHQLAQAA